MLLLRFDVGAQGKQLMMRWKLPQSSRELVTGLSKALGISRPLALALAARGLSDPDEARAFFYPSEKGDPWRMKGMEAAVVRILRAIETRETILLFSDYDVDGLCAAAILAAYLEEAGATFSAHQPDRLREGYGLNEAVVHRAARRGIGLIVTLDCGTSDHKEISLARRLGLDVIVVDHHLPATLLPDAYALLNPRQEDCSYPHKELAGAGVALRLFEALVAEGRAGPNPSAVRQLAALATVADLVPLRGENRALVSEGLSLMRTEPAPSLQVLLDSVSTPPDEVTARTLAFHLAPRLNAAGRMGQVEVAWRFLRESDPASLAALARRLDRLNAARRGEVENILEELGPYPDLGEDGIRIVSEEGWNRGVLGLVAGKLTEKHNLPALAVSWEGELGTGSARSIPGFDIHSALSRLSRHLLRFGGHRQAAGFSLARESFDGFVQELARLAKKEIPPGGWEKSLLLAGELELSEITLSSVRELDRLEPCGNDNSPALFMCSGASLVGSPRKIGRDGSHLSFVVAQAGVQCRCLAWNRAGDCADLSGECLEVAFRPEIDSWRGRSRVRLIVEDWRPSRKS